MIVSSPPLPDFGNQISAEIRLPMALDEGLLTPFQYLCISDNTDLRAEDLMKGNKYIATKLTEKLCNQERVGLIINKLHYYLPDETKCKALGFCASKEHARYMAEQFNASGLNADYLTSDRDSEREQLNRKLAKGKINYLFVVDIFNEGVDIPEVDVVLFLRPTESLTIFLQQLGRGLRLYPGKLLLTVFDFVAQLNKNYDFTSRFRSLMVRKDKSVVDQVKDGFTLLPHGCSIHMEEKAQQYVLENIKAAVYNRRRLIQELRSYDHIPTIKEFIENNGQDVALEQYGCYTREEIFTIFGRQAAEKRMQGSVSGVFNIEERNTELLFVTLNKSNKDFSVSTMYDDYVVSERQFHWKSKNTDTHEGRGKRYVEQAINKKKFLLFVRADNTDGFNNTCPFYCFGLVDYISSRDDKPMSIDWHMHHPILPQFIKAV